MIFSFPATGTLWQVDCFDEKISDNTKKQITDFVEDYEGQFSRFRDTSFVSKLANKAGTYKIPRTAKTLLDFYTKLYQLTSGIFTPTIGETLVSTGYDKNYSLTPQKKLAIAPDWNSVEYNEEEISSTVPVQLDFGAAGKGYLVDLLSDLITKMDYQNFCIDAGGDLKVVGDKSQIIGLEHPSDKTSVIGTIEIKNSSFCGSSGNRRQWANFHHIINSKELSSPKNILSTWVKAKDCLTADGIATANFLVSPKLLEDSFEFEYLILTSDYTIKTSKHFSATLFTENAS